MKKSYPLICVLLVVMMAVTAFAAKNAEMTFKADKKTVDPGETVEIAVTLSALGDCRSAGFTLYYDKAVFEFLDGSCSLKDVIISSVKDGTGVFTYGDPKPVSGELFTFRMKIKEGVAPGNYQIDTKGSVRNTDGAVTTTANEVSFVVALDSEPITTEPAISETKPEQETKPASDEIKPEQETKPASNETKPEKPTEPAKPEATEPTEQTKPVTAESTAPAETTAPETDTEPVSEKTDIKGDAQSADPEGPIDTIGAESDSLREGFPWWLVAVVAVIAVGGVVYVCTGKKRS